jgi:adenylate kinase
MTVVVLLGAPGAGKGTQAPVLARQLDVPVLASGDLLRAAVTAGTPLGREADRYMRRGQLVPDETIVRIFLAQLKGASSSSGAILDGFPRTRRQAEALDEVLARRGSRVCGVFYLDVDRDELARRLSGRWLCRESDDHVYHARTHPPKKTGVCDFDGAELYQRADDLPEVVRARLEKQLPPMFEVVDYYADQGVLNTVDGGRSPAEVTDALLRAIVQPAR